MVDYDIKITVKRTKRNLLGLKGQTFLEVGYVFVPYVPIQCIPITLE